MLLLLPAGLLGSHWALTNDVDDAKDEAALAEHGQVGSSHVLRHRAGSRLDDQVFKHLQQLAELQSNT